MAAFLGIIVAALSFGAMEFIVLRRFRDWTLPCLLLAVGGGLGLAVAFDEPMRTLYQLGWMLGMAGCVVIGFARRARGRL